MGHEYITHIIPEEQSQLVSIHVPVDHIRSLSLLADANETSTGAEILSASRDTKRAIEVGELALADFHDLVAEQRDAISETVPIRILPEAVDWIVDISPTVNDVEPFVRYSILRYLMQPENAQIATRLAAVRARQTSALRSLPWQVSA